MPPQDNWYFSAPRPLTRYEGPVPLDRPLSQQWVDFPRGILGPPRPRNYPDGERTPRLYPDSPSSATRRLVVLK
jgi:hypothetical protein